MEFILNNELATILPSEIGFNFEALKGELTENLKKYNELVVTEDSIKDAKSEKTSLNKLRTAIEDKRKEVKNSCLKPYELFEVKVKEIVGMIDKPILAIDKQVKVFENIVIEKKKTDINTYYAENIGELAELLPLSKFYDSRWENVGFKIKDAYKVILDTILKVKTELDTIDSLGSEYESQIKDKYLSNYNLTIALAEKSRLEIQAQKLKEYEEIQAQRKLVVPVVTKENQFDGWVEEKKPESVTQLETAAEVETMAQVNAILNNDWQPNTVKLKLWTSSEELKSVYEFFDACNIAYELI